MTKREDNLESTRGQPGRDRVVSSAHPRTPARLRVGGLGMAAALRKQAAGRPGSQQRGKTAGSGPVACERKRIELWPMQGPPERQQNRLQASRGSCGQWNDIGPGGIQSARFVHRQVRIRIRIRMSIRIRIRMRIRISRLRVDLDEE